jgi:hypothetical protein
MRAHGLRIGEAVPVRGRAEAEVAGTTAVDGVSVSGRVARPWAALPVGRNSGPFWPQAESRSAAAATTSSRRRGPVVLTRIWKTPNIWKL